MLNRKFSEELEEANNYLAGVGWGKHSISLSTEITSNPVQNVYHQKTDNKL